MTTLTTPAAPAPATGSGQRHLGWALVLISVAQLMVVLDATIANIALPFIKGGPRHLAGEPSRGSSPATPWPSAACCCSAAGSATSTAAAGCFMVGVVIFAAASLLGGLAQSEGLLLGAMPIMKVISAMKPSRHIIDAPHTLANSSDNGRLRRRSVPDGTV